MKSNRYEHQKNKNIMVGKKRILYLLIICIASIHAFGQSTKEAKASKQFENFAYIDAIKTYERIANKGYISQDLLQKLSDSYYFKADLENAAKWYGELFAFTQDVSPEYYYRYAQSLKSIKDYKKADEMMAKFYQKNTNDARAILAKSQKDYLAEIKKNSGRYTIENSEVNSQYSDYGSSYLGDKVVFASARDTTKVFNNKYKSTGENFTNLYIANTDSEGKLFDAVRFGNKLNSKFHEATPAFTKDGTTVYFTRNNFLNGKKRKDSQKTVLLKLYKATLTGDQWSNVVELPFNSNEYSVAHPSLNEEENTLYFASDMPGTLGQSDLFKVEIKSDGSYGKPINLGSRINTEGRETFPMITSKGELYFASDGHPGLGGLDVFVAKMDSNGEFENVQNVGEPINSSKDDFGFLIDDKTGLGCVTSNREGGKGGDDLYTFKEFKKLNCVHLLSGVVEDKDTKMLLANVIVTLWSSDFVKIKETVTDFEGKFDFGVVGCDVKYYIRTEKTDFITRETTVKTTKESDRTFATIELEPVIKVVKLGDDLFKALGLNIIYFDLDKSFIRKDASIELAKILDVLEQNPTMKIDIRSHTDCRSTAKYNLALSNRRAKETMEWLIKNGIEKSRLSGKGYGESNLINDCACENDKKSNCTEEEHQANRRSEFIIVQ